MDPSIHDQLAIYAAATNGHHDIVTSLLMDHRVDPTTHDNLCLREAEERGDVRMVQMIKSWVIRRK